MRYPTIADVPAHHQPQVRRLLAEEEIDMFPVKPAEPPVADIPAPVALSFFAHGTPAPGGSKRAFVIKGTGRANVVEDCKKSKPWREAVKHAALALVKDRPVIDEPIVLHVTFFMPRIKSHFNSKGQLKPNAPTHHSTKPDATKLLRSTEDALTGVVWIDDSRIVEQHVTKRYCDDGRPGARIVVEVARG